MDTKTIEVRPDLRVEMAALTVKESFAVDKIVAGFIGEDLNQTALFLTGQKVQTICSIRKINDAPVSPIAGGAAFEAVYQRFTLAEIGKLTLDYLELAGVDSDALKNALSAGDSAS